MPPVFGTWRRLFAAIDCPQMATEARCSTLAARMRNIDALYAIVAGRSEEYVAGRAEHAK